MTTRPPTEPAEAGPTPTISDGAPVDELDALSHGFTEKARRVIATLSHLRRLEPGQRTKTEGAYGVFDCAETGQLIILRGISALDGAILVHETASFEVALRWTNDRLAARLTLSRHPTLLSPPGA